MPGKKAETVWTQADVDAVLAEQRQDLEDSTNDKIQAAYAETFRHGFQTCLELAHANFDGTNGYKLLYKLQDYLDIQLGLWQITQSPEPPAFTFVPHPIEQKSIEQKPV